MKSCVAGAADVVLYQSGKLIAGILIGPAAAGAYEIGTAGYKVFRHLAGPRRRCHQHASQLAYATSGMDGIREQYVRLTRRNAAVAIFALLERQPYPPCAASLGEQHRAVTIVASSALAFSIAMNVSTAVCSATVYALGRAGLGWGLEGAFYAVVSVLLAVPLHQRSRLWAAWSPRTPAG